MNIKMYSLAIQNIATKRYFEYLYDNSITGKR